jgi:hypothetical protein
MVGPILALVAFCFNLFLSSSSISQKNDVTKILGPFDASKVPESQKHAKKKENMLRSVKNQMKGDCLENPQNQ